MSKGSVSDCQTIAYGDIASLLLTIVPTPATNAQTWRAISVYRTNLTSAAAISWSLK